jgi:hypothetical protein
MDSTRIATLMVIVSVLGCGEDLPNPAAVPATELAAVEHGARPPATRAIVDITIERRGALGFCPTEGMILSARVSSADGVLQGVRAAAGGPAIDDCLDHSLRLWGSCVVAEDFGPLALSEDQLTELGKRAAHVPEYSCEPYSGIACDPCLVTTVTMADTVLTDYCCGTMKKKYEKTFTALVSFLDSLARTPQ